MLLTKEVDVKLNGKNLKYYENLNYDIPKQNSKRTGKPSLIIGSIIKVKLEDIPEKTSKVFIECLCDYCLEEGKETIIKKSYGNYIKSNKNGIIHKDCCIDKNCVNKKRKENAILTHGVEHIAKLQTVKEKRKKTVIENYGVEYPTQNSEIKEKIKQTNLKRYGVEYTLQNKDIKEKGYKTNIKKYGFKFASQSDVIKLKTINTNIKKYGVSYYFNTEDYKTKTLNTNMKKYGIPFTALVSEFIEKKEKTNLLRYGFKVAIQNKEIKEKANETIRQIYNVENVFQNSEIKEKIKQTNLKRYGFYSPMKNKEVAIKSVTNSLISKYKNNTGISSKQQIFIHDLIGGELNYPVFVYSLDIAFPNEKIYVEYNGSGHNLSVVTGNITQEDFDKKELKRYYYLKNRGWKIIKIINTLPIKSKFDFLPNEEVLVEIINIAKTYVNENHSWYEINLDKKKLICSEYEIYYDFGNLSRVKEYKNIS